MGRPKQPKTKYKTSLSMRKQIASWEGSDFKSQQKKFGDPIAVKERELDSALGHYGAFVDQNTYDAMLSYYYNTNRNSGMKMVNSFKSYVDNPNDESFRSFVNSFSAGYNNKKLSGLRTRRNYERNLLKPILPQNQVIAEPDATKVYAQPILPLEQVLQLQIQQPVIQTQPVILTQQPTTQLDYTPTFRLLMPNISELLYSDKGKNRFDEGKPDDTWYDSYLKSNGVDVDSIKLQQQLQQLKQLNEINTINSERFNSNPDIQNEYGRKGKIANIDSSGNITVAYSPTNVLRNMVATYPKDDIIITPDADTELARARMLEMFPDDAIRQLITKDIIGIDSYKQKINGKVVNNPGVSSNDIINRLYNMWVSGDKPSISNNQFYSLFSKGLSNLKITTDTSNRESMDPITNTIHTTPEGHIDFNGFISELAHAIQHNDKSNKYYRKEKNMSTGNITMDAYNDPESREYITHKLVEPLMKDYIFGHSNSYNGYDKGKNTKTIKIPNSTRKYNYDGFETNIPEVSIVPEKKQNIVLPTVSQFIQELLPSNIMKKYMDNKIKSVLFPYNPMQDIMNEALNPSTYYYI